jgi:hypothetical protein
MCVYCPQEDDYYWTDWDPFCQQEGECDPSASLPCTGTCSAGFEECVPGGYENGVPHSCQWSGICEPGIGDCIVGDEEVSGSCTRICEQGILPNEGCWSEWECDPGGDNCSIYNEGPERANCCLDQAGGDEKLAYECCQGLIGYGYGGAPYYQCIELVHKNTNTCTYRSFDHNEFPAQTGDLLLFAPEDDLVGNAFFWVTQRLNKTGFSQIGICAEHDGYTCTKVCNSKSHMSVNYLDPDTMAKVPVSGLLGGYHENDLSNSEPGTRCAPNYSPNYWGVSLRNTNPSEGDRVVSAAQNADWHGADLGGFFYNLPFTNSSSFIWEVADYPPLPNFHWSKDDLIDTFAYPMLGEPEPDGEGLWAMAYTVIARDCDMIPWGDCLASPYMLWEAARMLANQVSAYLFSLDPSVKFDALYCKNNPECDAKKIESNCDNWAWSEHRGFCFDEWQDNMPEEGIWQNPALPHDFIDLDTGNGTWQRHARHYHRRIGPECTEKRLVAYLNGQRVQVPLHVLEDAADWNVHTAGDFLDAAGAGNGDCFGDSSCYLTSLTADEAMAEKDVNPTMPGTIVPVGTAALGLPPCGNTVCDGDETCDSCPLDCDCGAVCGTNGCEPGENTFNCPEDCGAPFCGDGYCLPNQGESCETCDLDCGICTVCGDGVCEGNETSATCPDDCTGFDGGFETDYGWTFNPLVDWPGTSFFHSTWGSAAPHSGTKAVAASNHAYGKPTTDFIPAGSGTHTIAAWVRGEMDDSSFGGYIIRAYFYDAGQQALSPTYQQASACTGSSSCVTTTWTKKSGTVTAPAGTAYIKIRLLSYMFGGWIAYDDVELDGTVLNVSTHGIDGGFETEGSLATEATGWVHEQVAAFPATSFFRWTSGSASPHSGSRALAVSNQAYAYPITTGLDLSPGNHTISAWIRGEMNDSSFGGWVVRALYYDASGTQLSWQNAAHCSGLASCLSTTWQQKSGTVTVPSNAASVKIQIYFYGASGWIAYDDVAVDGTVLSLAADGVDGGFESTDGWSLSHLDAFPASGIRHEADSAYVHSGSHGLYISNQAYAQAKTDYLPATAGDSYTLSLWLRGEMDQSSKGGWTIRVYFYDADYASTGWQNAASCTGTASCSLGLDWVQRSGVVTAPAGTAYMKAYLIFWRAGGWVAYDDVVLE